MKRERIPIMAVPILTLAALSACSAQGDHVDLADTTWRFIEIDGARPASSDAQLVFADDRLGADVGCNGIGGPWRVENDRLIAGPLEQQAAPCDGAVWGQEKAVGALLAAAPIFDVDGDTMTIKSSGHTAELRRTDHSDEG